MNFLNKIFIDIYLLFVKVTLYINNKYKQNVAIKVFRVFRVFIVLFS